MRREFKSPGQSRGLATLSITIVLLLVVTLITLNSSRLGFIELLVSQGYESRHTAFNKADSGLDAVLVNLDKIVQGEDPPGTAYCTTAQSKLSGCSGDTTISDNGWPSEFANAKHQAQLVYEGDRPAPRGSVLESTTALKFSHYLIRSIYDDRANRGGASEVVMAVMDEPYPEE